MGQKQRTTREAIVHVLQREARKGVTEMTTKDVVKAVIPLATGLKGKTKAHTIYTTMLAESKRPAGAVVQVKPGTYRLRREDEMPIEAPASSEAEASVESVEVKPDPKQSSRKRTSRKRSSRSKVPAAA